MISDDDRREVAERLRELPSTADADGCCTVWDILFALGMKASDAIGFVPTDNAMRLADLIDRPTCSLDLTDVETYGNAKVRTYECSECGRSCEEMYGEYERCPHCGARVVRGDE